MMGAKPHLYPVFRWRNPHEVDQEKEKKENLDLQGRYPDHRPVGVPGGYDIFYRYTGPQAG